MNRRSQNRPGSHHGFTILEILVAVTLSTMILVMAVQFLVSLSRDWSERDRERLFDEHVDGVIRFFETTLNKNVYDGRLSEEEDLYPALDHPPGYSDLREPMIRIRFPDGSPLFTLGDSPTGPVTAWFAYEEDQGVFALWRPDFEEEMDDINDFYVTPVTPWASGILFYYYDRDSGLWEEEDEVRLNASNEPKLPDRVKVSFAYNENIKKEVYLTLPRDHPSVFIY